MKNRIINYGSQLSSLKELKLNENMFGLFNPIDYLPPKTDLQMQLLRVNRTEKMKHISLSNIIDMGYTDKCKQTILHASRLKLDVNLTGFENTYLKYQQFPTERLPREVDTSFPEDFKNLEMKR